MMKKRALFLLLVFVFPLFASVPAMAQPDRSAAKEFVMQKISGITEALGFSEETVEAYLDDYESYQDFIDDLIIYKKYTEHDPEADISFDQFREDGFAFEQPEVHAENPFSAQLALASQSENDPSALIPEKELKDNRQYAALSNAESVDPASGKLMYKELDLHLPGVNGLDLNLISSFDQDESAQNYPLVVPGDYHPSPDGGTYEWRTFMVPYQSTNESLYNIGAGWGFLFSHIRTDAMNDRYHIRLAEGSVALAVDYNKDGVYEIYGRFMDDITFERKGDNPLKSTYIVTYKDGKKEFFNEDGAVTKTQDRYGNQIQYFYSDQGTLERIIDSAGRKIDFKRVKPTELEVWVDGNLQCEYGLDNYYDNRYLLRTKQIQGKNRIYYYENIETKVNLPTTTNADTNYMLALSGIVYYTENYESRYTYEVGNESIYNDSGSSGSKQFPRVIHKENSSTLETDNPVNQANYTYEGYLHQEGQEYKMTEEIPETGVKTENTSNFLGYVTKKKYMAPDNGQIVETVYTYDEHRLRDSYTQTVYSGDSSYTIGESFSYDNKGNLTSHTDVSGNFRTYRYDPDTSVLLQMTEPVQVNGVNTTRYTNNVLDDMGNIISTQISTGNNRDIVQTVVCDYDAYGNVISRKNLPAYMEPEIFEYTPNRVHVAKYKKGDTLMAEYAYDNLGRQTYEKDGLGRQTKYQYSKNNRLAEVINPDGTNKKNLYYIDLSYYAQADIIFDEKGPIQKLGYDNMGRLTQIYDISIPESEFQFNNRYHFSDYELDETKFLDLVSAEYWELKESFSYDAIGRMTASMDANGTTQYRYDAFDRVVEMINPDSSSVKIQYDDINRTRTVIDEEGKKTTEYFDEKGRAVAQEIFPEENTSLTQRTEYDAAGRVISTTDYNGAVTSYTYDALGRSLSVTNALGEKSIVRYAPDLSSTIEYYPDGEVRQSSFYDKLGRLNAVTDEYFNIESFGYDAAGNMVSSVDKNGRVTEYVYNNRNMLMERTGDGYRYAYTYDSAGKTLSASKEEGERSNAVSYDYYVNGTVKTESTEKFNSSQNVSFTTEYDAVNLPSAFQVDDSEITGKDAVNYSRNNLGLITGVNQASTEAGNKNAGYTYYRNGLLKEETLPNGHKSLHSYDGAGRLISTTRKDRDGNLVKEYQYAYDGNGNRVSVVEKEADGSSTTITYAYDALNRLTAETNGKSGKTTAYTFDCRNNMIQRQVSGAENYTEEFIYTPQSTEGYKTRRRIEKIKKSGAEVINRTYYYQEPNGNTVQKLVLNEESNTPEQVVSYSYNAENMLTRVEVDHCLTGKQSKTQYAYDALNRRQVKDTQILENNIPVKNTRTEYFWYGDEVQYEKVTSDGGEPARKVNLWGIGGLLARDDEVYSTDGHGSVDTAYDGIEAIREYDYDAYGNQLNPEAGDENPYRYSGENFDEETGLYDLRARYYDPELGRFLTEDPAKDGLNWYVYCGNNPVMFVDPWGLEMSFQTMEDANRALEISKRVSGYDGYYVEELDDGTFTIQDNKNGQISGGSDVARAVINAMISVDQIIPIVFNDKIENNGGTDYNPDGSVKIMEIGKTQDTTILDRIFVHEGVHALVAALGLYKNLIIAYQDNTTEAEREEAGFKIWKKYTEAVAITVERQMSIDLGYEVRTDIGVNSQGTFPWQLTTDPRERTMVGPKRIGDIAIATNWRVYGSGIVDYLIQNYTN